MFGELCNIYEERYKRKQIVKLKQQACFSESIKLISFYKRLKVFND